MNLETAKNLAERARAQLTPTCDSIQIAGSIRRGKPEGIKDIELVCIPRQVEVPHGLFAETVQMRDPEFARILRTWNIQKGKPEEGRYIQCLPGGRLKVDVFIANPDNWGWQLVLRTGSGEFNIKLLERLRKREIISQGGFLRYQRSKLSIATPHENHIFDLADLPYIEPKDRTPKRLAAIERRADRQTNHL